MASYRTSTPAGGPVGDLFAYSTVVRVDRHVRVSGAAPYDDAGQLIRPDDVYAQAHQAITNLEQALRSVGAALEDVVATRIFVLDMKTWKEVGKAHGERFHHIRPAATLVEVRGVLGPGMMVEIEAEAILRAGDAV